MKKTTFRIFIVIALGCFVSCGNSTSSGTEASGVKPVVQIPFQFDVTNQVFKGTLTGTADLNNTYSEVAFDPDGGSLAAYNWNFGDGSTSSETEPLHSFSTPGAHVVTLTVQDNENETCDAAMTVVVTSTNNDPPAVRIQASGLVTLTGADYGISFIAMAEDAESDQLTYLWNFGDGTSATTRVANKTYSSAGEYQPSVTVTDSAGNSSSAHVCVVVFPSEEDKDGNTTGPDDFFTMSCAPNPGSFVHGSDTTVNLTLPLGPGTPISWQIISGVAGAPLQSSAWTGNDTFSVPAVEDSPPRIEYFPVRVSASNLNNAVTEDCDVFVYHFNGGGGGGAPPRRDIGENGDKVIYTVDTLATRGETLDVNIQMIDANGNPLQGEFSVTLAPGSSPDDPAALHSAAFLNSAGIAKFPLQMSLPAGAATLYGSFGGTRTTLTTVSISR
ncbi:MAG: PKD domain-containing protein [Deltaproteobacteria bacterium]|nr:PKD domain-containing protein [Deltaproteobacteria bacterium]